MLELLVRALEQLERLRDPAGDRSTRCVRVHTATGDVTLKLRLPA